MKNTLNRNLCPPGSSDETSVDHPHYYGGKENPMEAIKIIEHFSLDFHLGNVLKYIIRNGKKNSLTGIKDLEKAAWYLNRKINILKEKER